MARIPPPLSSFGSELQAVLRKGADAEFRIKFPDKGLAIRFRQRLNQLRAAMKREKRPDWEQFYRCGIYIDPKDSCVVIVAPRDSEFRAFLGSDLPEVPAPPPVREVEVGPSSPENVDSFLSELSDLSSVRKNLEKDTDEEPPLSGL